MFNGRISTYLDVRKIVEATYGALDEASEIQFLLSLGNMMQQFWTELRLDPFFQKTWTLTPEEDGSFSLPDDIARICKATGLTTVGDGETVVSTAVQLHEPSCNMSPDCAPIEPISWCCANSKTVSATILNGSVVLEETPGSLVIEGTRFPADEFFVEEATDGQLCRNWLDVDLPREYRNVFSKAVTGYMFFICGDAPRGAENLNLANSELMSIRTATSGGLSGTRSSSRMFTMGKGRINRPSCCSSVEPQGWWL